MTTEESILNKIQILITNHFDTPEDAFSFFDADSSGKLKKSEIVKLLKQAEISGFIRGLVGSKLIEGYDKSDDEEIDWQEFKAAVDKIRTELIDKIRSIRNKEFLQALDTLVSSNSSDNDRVELTTEQKEMLEMSKDDIKNGRLISQEVMNKRNMEWLNGLSEYLNIG